LLFVTETHQWVESMTPAPVTAASRVTLVLDLPMSCAVEPVAADGRHVGLGGGVLSLLALGEEDRDGDGGEDADDDHDNEELDEREAALVLLLGLADASEHLLLSFSFLSRPCIPHPVSGRRLDDMKYFGWRATTFSRYREVLRTEQRAVPQGEPPVAPRKLRPT
jgi:hypothetical protein